MKKNKDIALGIFASIIYMVLMHNRYYIKTNFQNGALTFILNTLPNFFAGICFTYLFYKIIFYLYGKEKDILAFFITIGWLTIEEYYPVFSHNNYFDYNDILMSLIGGSIALIIIKYVAK